MNGCSCQSDLNIFVCRTISCGFTGRFIDSAPFIAGAIAIFLSGAVTRFTIDRLLSRKEPSQSDAADFADYVSEATGLVVALLIFVIGFIVVASGDNLQSAVVLLGVFALVPLVWIVGQFISERDPIKYTRKKRGRALGWRSYTLAIANILAVALVFLVI